MKVVITGGAGFIGTNAAQYFLNLDWEVVLFDNFSRAGCNHNVQDLEKHPSFKRCEIQKGDIRRAEDLDQLFSRHAGADLVIHLAAQVAVTTSVVDPRLDFDINALGTFNVLEALRKARFQGLLIYSSTNKVYGEMHDLKVVERETRYTYEDLSHGVAETYPLDFHSPYGCSKGAADQYVRDYARIYGLKTAVFRQSCIYGPHQYGVEDQGWVAWFMIATVLKKPITVYGDGKQVRDILYAGDLAEAFHLAWTHRARVSGKVYNMGGGPQSILSILELLKMLNTEGQLDPKYGFDQWRPGDQKVFVADTRLAREDFGWEPKTDVLSGFKKVLKWVEGNQSRFLK